MAGELAMLPCQHFYNVVLSRGHVITINGVECITLGYHFENPKTQHPYFGSEQDIRKLQQDPGWAFGLVEKTSGPQCSCPRNRQAEPSQLGLRGDDALQGFLGDSLLVQ